MGHFLVEFVISWFIKQNQIVQLVTNFSLGPLLQTQEEQEYVERLLNLSYGGRMIVGTSKHLTSESFVADNSQQAGDPS